MRPTKTDIAVSILLPVLAGACTVVFHTNLFVSVLLFFGLPSLYLSIRNPGIFRKSFLFAFLLSIGLSLFIDTLAAVNGAWVIPTTIFPFRIFGVATVEVYMFGLLWILYATLFYEHFFDKGKKRDAIAPQVRYLECITAMMVAYAIAAFFFDKALLHIPYFYVSSGIVLVITPLALFLRRYPSFSHRYLLIGSYFFYLLLIFELVALHNGQWIFPAKDFIGMIDLFGYRFPVEEMIVWMAAATPAALSYYEYFADDRHT